MKNSRLKYVMAGTIVTALAVALCGCSGNIGPDENRYEEPASGEVSGGYTLGNGTASTNVQNLNIEWVAGEVNVVFADVDEIQFEETAKKELKADAQMRYKEENGTLTISFCKDTIVGISDIPEKDLTLTLPKGYQFSNVDLEVVSSDVSLPAGFTADALDMEAVSGELRSEGEITVAQVDVEAVSGNVDLEVKGLEAFEAEEVSGDVVLTLPEDTEFKADIDAASGEFSSDFETRIEDGAYIHGAGTTKIDMESVSGNLEILMQK